MYTVEQTDLSGNIYSNYYLSENNLRTFIDFRQVASRLGISASFVDATNLENVKAAFKPETKV